MTEIGVRLFPDHTNVWKAADFTCGDNISSERAAAVHASAKATLPTLRPMSGSGGSAGTVQIAFCADDHFKVSVVSARASLMARDEIPADAAAPDTMDRASLASAHEENVIFAPAVLSSDHSECERST